MTTAKVLKDRRSPRERGRGKQSHRVHRQRELAERVHRDQRERDRRRDARGEVQRHLVHDLVAVQRVPGAADDEARQPDDDVRL